MSISIDDLYYALRKQNDGEDQYALMDLQDLANNIKDNPQEIFKSLQEYITNKALDLDYCPKCFCRLSTHLGHNEEVDFMGSPARETIGEKYCTECGWEEND